MIVGILVVSVAALELLSGAIALMYAESAYNQADRFVLVIGAMLVLAIAAFQAALIRTAGARLVTALILGLALATVTLIGAGVAIRLLHA